jgi:hypothetical protein
MITDVSLELAEFRERFAICDLEYREWEEPTHRRMLKELRYKLASTKQEPVIVRWPKTWWQHLKQRFFARWMLKRWPVEYAEKRIDLKLVYPHLKSPLPVESMGHSVTVVASSDAETHFWNCSPETPLSESEIKRVARNHLFWNPLDNHCPTCLKAISFQ